MTDGRDQIDPKLDALLREHSTDAPSSDIDAAILAAAPRAGPSAAQASPWREPDAVAQRNAAAAMAGSAAPRATAPALAKQSVAAADVQATSPEQWIARIRALLADGKTQYAEQELIAFRAAYPDADARLPAELRAWAATVKR